MLKTQTISIRELRQNLSLYLRATELKNIHFVVMRHAEPIARIVPEKRKKKTRKLLREELLRDIREAQAQIARGEWYTTEEVRQHLGLPPLPSNGHRRRKKT